MCDTFVRLFCCNASICRRCYYEEFFSIYREDRSDENMEKIKERFGFTNQKQHDNSSMKNEV